ncbi:MAG: hypothetical protein ACKO5E_08810 [bacterium]
MQRPVIRLILMAFVISLSGCSGGGSTPAPAGGESKAASPADVQKELEKISPPSTGKASKKK